MAECACVTARLTQRAGDQLVQLDVQAVVGGEEFVLFHRPVGTRKSVT